LKLNDFKTMRISANYKWPVKKRIKSYVPNICSFIKLLLHSLRRAQVKISAAYLKLANAVPKGTLVLPVNSIQLFIFRKEVKFPKRRKDTFAP